MRTAGNLLQSNLSGRGLASSSSFGEGQLSSGQDSPAGGSTAGFSPSAGASAEELAERAWGLLVEGLQPYMCWELQAGMGDFWEQVCYQHNCLLHLDAKTLGLIV